MKIIRINVVMYNIHTRDEVKAFLIASERTPEMTSYLVSWFGVQEKITSYQGWMIKEEL